MAQITPVVRNDSFVYFQNKQDHLLMVGRPVWYAWLETVTTFAFQSDAGTFTARKEQVGNQRGGWYWKAYRKRDGRLYRAYLGKSEELTLARLQEVAATLAAPIYLDDQLSTHQPGENTVQTHLTSNTSKGDFVQDIAPASEPANESRYASCELPELLPVPLTPLIGRTQEVKDICTMLKRQEVRLLTLTGMGGIGKTRLGLQVAHEMMQDFGDGVRFIPLASIYDAGLVVAAIAQSLGFRKTGGQMEFEQMAVALRDKHLLLLLDNFEQVLTAGPLLVDLLEVCPGLKALVTSRAVLRLRGEHLLQVQPLALPDLKHLSDIAELSQYAAVALFMQRAVAIKPDFAITGANASAIAKICAYLDGLPLAIELAAAYVKLLSPQALLTRLTSRLHPLTAGGAQDLPERQQTLRKTLMWSYNLLTSEEQQFFQQLSIFVGGCTMQAAERVCRIHGEAETNVFERIASLLDKSLLQHTEQGENEVRLLMLETVREFGLECLRASGEKEAIQHAHAHYYLTLAEEAEKELGGTQQAAWLDQLEREHENLREALSWLIEHGAGEDVLRLGGALWWFWSVRGHVSEGRRWLERILASTQRSATVARAKALNGAGMLALNQDDYRLAETLCREGLSLSRELDDKGSMATSLYRLGLLTWWQREYVEARTLEEEALALFKEIGDVGSVADPLIVLSNIAFAQGEYPQARSLAEESLALFRTFDDKWGIAYALLHLAHIIFSQGDVEFAQPLIEECLRRSTELGYKEGIADSFRLMGQFALQRGDTVLARSMGDKSLLIFREVGDRRGTAKSLFLLAQANTAQGNVMEAGVLYEESLTIGREVDDKEGIAACLEGLAGLSKEAFRQTEIRPVQTAKFSRYPDELTAREIEVLRLVARGMTDVQVAEQLIISHRTVHAHLSSIYSKLGISSRSAATRYALEHRLL